MVPVGQQSVPGPPLNRQLGTRTVHQRVASSKVPKLLKKFLMSWRTSLKGQARGKLRSWRGRAMQSFSASAQGDPRRDPRGVRTQTLATRGPYSFLASFQPKKSVKAAKNPDNNLGARTYTPTNEPSGIVTRYGVDLECAPKELRHPVPPVVKFYTLASKWQDIQCFEWEVERPIPKLNGHIRKPHGERVRGFGNIHLVEKTLESRCQ